jgi:hypothetical protein
LGKIFLPDALNLILLLVAGALALLAFMAKYNTPESRKWWGYFLFLGFFIFLEKVFENILVFKRLTFFVNLECFAGLTASIVAVVVSYLGYRRYVTK